MTALQKSGKLGVLRKPVLGEICSEYINIFQVILGFNRSKISMQLSLTIVVSYQTIEGQINGRVEG